MDVKNILDKQIAQLPKEIKFCRRGVVSNQRPRMVFDKEWICGACKYTDIKNNGIEWGERERELKELCDFHRSSEKKFDVIVPSSGGKDSARVAWELKYKYGMHPLTVTWAPFEYTDIGYNNFRNFIKVGGLNNLMAWQNGIFHRKLSKLSFEMLGDAWQPFTYGQMSYAFHMAKALGIKLVFFGENGEAEYSGNPQIFKKSGMPITIWNEQYFKGVTIRDLIKYGLEETDYLKEEDFDESDITFYEPPKTEDLKSWGAEFKWFSYYKKWVPQENYYLAAEKTGFQANPEGRSEGTYSKYASLDDQMDGFHFYHAFSKFGICRCTSDAAHEIRDGHITREEGVSLVKRYDGEFPKMHFNAFLDYLNITTEQFWRAINRFRTPHIWKHVNGEWRLRSAVYDVEGRSKEVPMYISSIPVEMRSMANAENKEE